MPRVLIVDPDDAASTALAAAMQADAIVVAVVTRGDLVSEQVSAFSPDLILLDVVLPDMSGLDLCRQLREQERTVDIPIIIASRLGAEEDIVQGLDAGADDYLAKPVAVRELLARVRSALRRSNAFRVETDQIEVGEVVLNRRTRRVTRRSIPIHLAPTEFEMLQFLMERPGRIFSREQLKSGIWGHASEITDRAIDVNIGRLRRALSKGGEGETIRTVRNEGYYFDSR